MTNEKTFDGKHCPFCGSDGITVCEVDEGKFLCICCDCYEEWASAKKGNEEIEENTK